MSGVAGGNRIEKGNVQATFNKYVDTVLKHIPGFKKASLSGSVKTGAKADYGDLDLIVWFEGNDKREVKQRIISAVLAQPSSVIVPFKSEKHAGKRYYNAGELISVLFPIEGKEDEYIQVDNIIALTEEEHTFKNSFLDLPAEKQGLILGLSKVILIEEDPATVFHRMGISGLPTLGENEEFEFNLSSVKLTLRKVKLENGREVAREDLWSTTNWGVIKILFKNFNIDGSFEDLLDDIARKLKNPRSKHRIAGIFKSMISVKSGEVGTPKGANKEAALEKVAQTLAEALEDGTDIAAIYAGGFKPPHKAHFENAKILSTKADKLIVFIGHKIREGLEITAQQSKAIWEIYAKYINVPVEVFISEKTPILDTYLWIDANQDNLSKVITGTTAEEMSKFSGITKNKEKYAKVELMELPVIATKEDDKFSATVIRSSKEYLKSGKWLPSELSREDKQAAIDILTPKEQVTSVEDEMADAISEVFDSLFESNTEDTYYLDTPKFNYERKLPEQLYLTLNEITLSTNNAAELEGDFYFGFFTVGDVKYNYNIGKIDPNPYGDGESFYNVGFTPVGETTSTPLQGKENYIKILSTMYKVILNLIDKVQPDYIGIGSLDNEGGSNYHRVYANLTDNTSNNIPGYFRKDVALKFNGPQGSGQMVVMKKKKETQPLDETQGEFNYLPYIESLLEYMEGQGMAITPLPTIKTKQCDIEASSFFGRTAYYDPNAKEVILYTKNRHPKDVVRSFAHEMIHHIQNMEGRLQGVGGTSNTNEDDALLEIEKEAYLLGNITFRNWEDQLKNGGDYTDNTVNAL